MNEAPQAKIHVIPGGKMPERQTDGAVGFDVFSRAVVSAHEMDPENPKLRKTIFNFESFTGYDEIDHFIEMKHGDYVYRLEPGKMALVGIGFVFEMDFPFFYWVAPRSGLSSKHGVTIANTPGTVDPDYRGEAGVILVNHSEKSFHLKQNMRIAQIIFMPAIIPDLEEVQKYSDLSQTERGAGGFGSTGV